MMVKTKGVNVPISTIYYWIRHGHLGLTSLDMCYPRKVKTKKQVVKPVGKLIEEPPESINKHMNIGDFEIDTVIQIRTKTY